MNIRNKKHLLIFRISFILLGSILGYVYWYYIGCKTGTCPITSQWHNTTIYGALMGYLVGEILKDLIFKNRATNNEQISENNK